MNLRFDVFAIQGRIQPVLRFGLLGIGITQFADKMSLITSFLPGLCQIGTNGPRRTPDLVRQTRTFLLWERPWKPQKSPAATQTLPDKPSNP